MKHNILKTVIMIIAAICVLIIPGCSKQSGGGEDSGKLKIVSTVFPPYDFAKHITGDNAELSILLPPGNETHTYEPSPSDIISIQNCDLFLYIGGENEQWAEKLLANADASKVKAVKLIDYVTPLSEEDEESGGHEEQDEHHHEYDQHIWTSPSNAIVMLNAIYDAICEADSGNKETYTKNRDSYKAEIEALRDDIRSAVDNAKNKIVVFGDRFPFRYFADEFGLTCYAAFASCSDESEPSAATVTRLIETIKENSIPVVYYLEFSSRKVSDTLCEQTGAKALMLHSCHNVSKEDLENGESYVSLMRTNLKNLEICFAG